MWGNFLPGEGLAACPTTVKYSVTETATQFSDATVKLLTVKGYNQVEIKVWLDNGWQLHGLFGLPKRVEDFSQAEQAFDHASLIVDSIENLEVIRINRLGALRIAF